MPLCIYFINCLFWYPQSYYGNLGLGKILFFRFCPLIYFFSFPLREKFWQRYFIRAGPCIRPVAFWFSFCSSWENSWKHSQAASTSSSYIICATVMIPLLNGGLNQNGKLNGRAEMSLVCAGNFVLELVLLLIWEDYLSSLPDSLKD